MTITRQVRTIIEMSTQSSKNKRQAFLYRLNIVSSQMGYFHTKYRISGIHNILPGDKLQLYKLNKIISGNSISYNHVQYKVCKRELPNKIIT